MEAILCETKVICSNIDALRLIVNLENVVNKNDPIEFFLAIQKQILEKKNNSYFKERRKFISKNFSLKNMKKSYTELYKTY